MYIGIVATSVCVLALTVLLVRRERVVTFREFQTDQLVREWEALVDDSSYLGQADAPHTLVVFTDYECKRCRDYDLLLRDLLTRYPAQLRIVIHHDPLRAIHSGADMAAVAAECAAAMGEFPRYHAVLFSKGDSLSNPHWGRWALEASIRDTTELVSCVADRKSHLAVTKDIVFAQRLELTHSPSVMLDGVLMGSLPTEDDIVRRIEGRVGATDR